MKVWIDYDEQYPIFFIVRPESRVLSYYSPAALIDIDAVTLARWERVLEAHDEVQEEMRAFTRFKEGFK